MSQTTTSDPLTSYRAGLTIAQKGEEMKAEVKRLKEAAAAAEKELTEHNKSSRDAARSQARRAQFIGEIFLVLAGDSPMMWQDFRPHLDAALNDAPEDVRGLFGLTPVLAPKVDTKEGSQAAEKAGEKSEEKAEEKAEKAVAEQPK